MKFIFVLILSCLVCPATYSEEIESISLETYPIESLYVINNPKSEGTVVGSDYQDACSLLGDYYFWGVVSSKSATPACYSKISYNMVIGAETWRCSDGSNAYFNIPHNYCPPIEVCPDASWTLTDKNSLLLLKGKSCQRDNYPCKPDIANVSEEQALAALTYGESHWSNNYKEMAAIASAAYRRMQAKGYKSINELILKDKNFSYATAPQMRNERYYNLMCGINSPGVQMAYKAARNALDGGTDYSNGACFWDGVDLKVNGKNAYRYKVGFKFANTKHNILSVEVPPPKRRKGKNNKFYEYTYISTTGINKTIFWKYTTEVLEAGETQCL